MLVTIRPPGEGRRVLERLLRAGRGADSSNGIGWPKGPRKPFFVTVVQEPVHNAAQPSFGSVARQVTRNHSIVDKINESQTVRSLLQTPSGNREYRTEVGGPG
jgi:hypothetical protein